MVFDIIGLRQNRAEWSGIHDKEDWSKHRTLGDSKKEFDGIGPDGEIEGNEPKFGITRL